MDHSAQRVSSDTQRWLERLPREGSEGPNIPHLTWGEWVAEGMKLPNLEDQLLDAFSAETNVLKKSRIAVALGRFGTERSVWPLIEALQRDTILVQIEAAAALGEICQIDSVDALVKAAESPDENVRANCLISLGKIGGEKATKCIQKGMQDENKFVRSCALEAEKLLEAKKTENRTFPPRTRAHITRIEAELDGRGIQVNWFTIRPEDYDSVLRLFANGQQDPNPFHWIVLGGLNFTFDDGSTKAIHLFQLGNGPGAYKIGDTYYRGSSTQEIIQTLVACSEKSRTAR